MSDITKINLGLDSTGKGGDSQRTAFEKCNDNFDLLDSSLSRIKDTVSSVTQNIPNYAHNGENTDITDLKGLKHNVVQPADAADDMGSVTLRQLNAKFALGSGNVGGITRVVSDFIGAMQWFNGSRVTIPAGYTAADGQLLKRQDYPELWEKLSNNMLNCVSDADWLADSSKRASFSYGDGLTTFRMPDINGKQDGSLKGLFIRGDGYAASGTVQGDAIRNIQASIAAAGAVAWQGGSGAFNLRGSKASCAEYDPNSTKLPIVLGFDASLVVPTSDENRPVSANLIAIFRTSGLMMVDTRQEVVTATTKPPKAKEIVSGGVIESSFTVNGTKSSSATFNSIKTAGVDGAGIQFTSTDFSTKQPVTRQYTLNSDSGEIFTYSNLENGRSKLGLGSAATYNIGQSGEAIPVLNRENIFSGSQIIKTRISGTYGLKLEHDKEWWEDNPIVGQVVRGPLFISCCPNWGINKRGTQAEFFIEETPGYSSQAVIGLKSWDESFRHWVFKSDNNAYSNGTWISSSDERLKTEFKPIGEDRDILEQCKSFRGYTFKLLTNNNYDAGFKAQDILKVLPESVYVNQDITLKDGTFVKDSLSLNYGAMSAFNHECILALIERLEEAEKTIAKLQESLNGKV